MNHRFVRRLAGGGVYHLGTAVQYTDGWRFLSNVSSHRSSRKFHATMEKCVPRWVGYPNKCESEAVPTYHCSADERDKRVVWPWRRDEPYPGSKP